MVRVDPPAHVREMRPHAFGQGLGELASGTVVGEHLVTAWPLQVRSERPRAGDLDLEDAMEVLRLLLQQVQVLAEERTGASMVHAWRLGQPPPGWLQVEAEIGDGGESAAHHAGMGTAR